MAYLDFNTYELVLSPLYDSSLASTLGISIVYTFD